MSDLDELFAQLPIDQIAKRLGVDEKTAESAVRTALPTLVAGLSANAGDANGAASLERALQKHSTRSTSLADVDEADGEKIVRHVFGDKKDAVAAAASTKSNATQEIIAKILPIVAPIVLAWLAQKFFGNKDAAATESAPKQGSGGIGDLLGGLLGGSAGSSGGGIGDLLGGLGGLLGGGKK